MIKLTKKAKKELHEQHPGTGTIVYKSAKDELKYIDFYISRKTGEMMNVHTGKKIEQLEFIEY